MQIFMLWRGYVYLIDIPSDYRGRAYSYGRERLGAQDHEITCWGEVNANMGIARFNYRFTAT